MNKYHMRRWINLFESIIDPSLYDTFKYGGCGILALAIHEATGWTIYALTDAADAEDWFHHGGGYEHIWVVNRSQQAVDIDGVHDAWSDMGEGHITALDADPLMIMAKQESDVYDEACRLVKDHGDYFGIV